MKQTKLVAVLSAAALLAIGASMTSFAGWVQDGDVWHYQDSDGNYVTGEWRKDNGVWFYLDDDGDMLTNSWVDEEKYVGENGARVQNAWVKTFASEADLDDPDTEEHWYYFDSKGNKVKGDGDTLKSKKIGEKYYLFNGDGEMQTGWVQNVTDNGTDVYYLGGEDEGWKIINDWRWLEEPDEDAWHKADGCGLENECDDEGWYWFDASGKMNKKTTRKVNGKHYFFNEHGQMLYEWINGDKATPTMFNDTEEATGANIKDMRFAADVSDGSRGSGWELTTGSYGVGSQDDLKWYWFKDGVAKHASEDGKLLVTKLTWKADGTTKTGKFAFNYKGEMQTGLKVIDGTAYYFDGNGYMKSGKLAIDDDNDDTYNFYFEAKNANFGAGINRIKDKTLYVLGQKICAEDKYAVVKVETFGSDNGFYLVNKSGKIQANKDKIYEIDNGGFVKVNEKGIVQSWAAKKEDTFSNSGIAAKAYKTGLKDSANEPNHLGYFVKDGNKVDSEY